MKRKLSVFLAGILLSQSIGMIAVNAEEVTDIYADIYEISMNLGSEIRKENITLYLGEELVDVDIISEGKKISITPKSGYFETDKVYKLNVGDSEKEFKIKTLYSENFDEMSDEVVNETVSNFYGNMNFASGDNGNTFYQDNKLVLADAFMSISDFEAAEDGKITFSADIEGYGKKGYKSDGVSTYTANAGYVTGYIGAGSNDADSINGAVAMELKNRSFKGGNFDGNGAYSETVESANDYPNIGSIADNRFGFSKVTDDGVVLTSYSYETASETRSMAIRKKDDGLYGLSDGVELIKFGDADVDDDILSFMADYRTVMVLDNILVTCYTEDVAEPEKGEVKAISMDADFDSMNVTFDRTLKGTSEFSKIHVYENDLEVKADITFSNDEKTVVKIVPESYYSGNTYKVVIEEGFGTKHMWTYEEVSFEKYLEPQYINVKDSVIDALGITVSFEEVIPAGADKTKIKVYKNDEVCEASVFVYEDYIIIKPSDYELNNVYKVVIESGFGDKNIYLEEDYTFEGEYVKAVVEVEKVSGNANAVYITMNEDISEVDDLSFVEIYKDDIEIPSDVSVSGNVITIISGEEFITDEIYEVYVGCFETEDVAMNKAFRKQFTMKQILFEDFEDGTFAEGISISGGATLVDGKKISGIEEGDEGKNKRRILQGNMTFSGAEIENAENLDISFDYQLFNANLNNTDKQYTASVPYTLWFFNRQGSDANSGYRLYVNPSGVRNQYFDEKEGKFIDFSTLNSQNWNHGDMWYDKESNAYYVYETGDALPFEKNGRTVSERDIPPVSKIRIIKNGEKVYAYRDDEMIVKSEPTANVPMYKTGSIVLNTQITEFGVYDNVEVRVFEIIDGSDVTASSLNISDMADGTISGSFIVGNYTDEDMPLKAGVCVYGEDNLMQAMEIVDISAISAGEKQEIEFAVDKTENVKKVKVFLWKSLEGLEQYGNYDFVIQ